MREGRGNSWLQVQRNDTTRAERIHKRNEHPGGGARPSVDTASSPPEDRGDDLRRIARLAHDVHAIPFSIFGQSREDNDAE